MVWVGAIKSIVHDSGRLFSAGHRQIAEDGEYLTANSVLKL